MTDELSYSFSKITTKQYSTSFSFGILALKTSIHLGIYAIYGCVRLADEIVDSFHNYDKVSLLAKVKNETKIALNKHISLNPILQSVQQTVPQYNIEVQFVEQLSHSIKMDLQKMTIIQIDIINTYMVQPRLLV